MTRSRPLVLHVLPLDLARGAQRHARALCDTLNARNQDHRVLTLFASESFGLKPDYLLNAKAGPLRAVGFSPKALVRLRRALRRLEPSLVVAHGSESLKYVMPSRPRGTPVIYHRIGVPSRKLGNPLRLFLHRGLVKTAEAIVGISDDSVADLRLAGVARVEVIPNARSAQVFSPTRGDLPVNGRPRLLFLGHLVASKRPHLFLKVIAGLRARGLEFDAAIAGDGPLRSDLEATAEMVGAEMLGNREDIPELLNRASFLIFTSVSEAEGMPGVLIEAGLCGIPVVSTDVPGARDVILNGVTGFVVGTDNAEELVSASARLISDPQLRTGMGEQARIRCVERFDVETCASRWSDLIEQMLS